MSHLIKSTMEEETEEPPSEVQLPKVTSCTLAKVIEFCQHYHTVDPMSEIEKPLKSGNMSEVVSKWYADYVDVNEKQELFHLIMAANYMDIKPLLELTAAKIASQIKGKAQQEIRETVNVPSAQEE